MANPSVMVLVKNESYFLPYVLLQTEGVFDSYVIYDIGSTDNTRAIIDWFVNYMAGQADMFVRYMPHVPKEVQGAFRNSMIAEGQRDIYMILDGDELYKTEHLTQIPQAAETLRQQHRVTLPTKRFGVFKRIEVSPDLTQRYNKERSHHRLYTRDAFWHGTHPGEVSGYEQNADSEIWFPEIKVYHMHNTVRSPLEQDALGRLDRKKKKTYHPDAEGMSSFDLLAELPILQKPIEDFPVSPSLAALQAKSRDRR